MAGDRTAPLGARRAPLTAPRRSGRGSRRWPTTPCGTMAHGDGSSRSPCPPGSSRRCTRSATAAPTALNSGATVVPARRRRGEGLVDWSAEHPRRASGAEPPGARAPGRARARQRRRDRRSASSTLPCTAARRRVPSPRSLERFARSGADGSTRAAGLLCGGSTGGPAHGRSELLREDHELAHRLRSITDAPASEKSCLRHRRNDCQPCRPTTRATT